MNPKLQEVLLHTSYIFPTSRDHLLQRDQLSRVPRLVNRTHYLSPELVRIHLIPPPSFGQHSLVEVLDPHTHTTSFLRMNQEVPSNPTNFMTQPGFTPYKIPANLIKLVDNSLRSRQKRKVIEGRLPKTDFASVILPAKERCLAFHLESLIWNLSITGCQKRVFFIFTPIGIPR
ncbi:hypothetical protein Hdeb2414_s0020g00555191 [Helianthus debilis subsp. tardiflorus]